MAPLPRQPWGPSLSFLLGALSHPLKVHGWSLRAIPESLAPQGQRVGMETVSKAQKPRGVRDGGYVCGRFPLGSGPRPNAGEPE